MNTEDLFIENRTPKTGKTSKKAIITTVLLHTGVSKFSFIKNKQIKLFFDFFSERPLSCVEHDKLLFSFFVNKYFKRKGYLIPIYMYIIQKTAR